MNSFFLDVNPILDCFFFSCDNSIKNVSVVSKSRVHIYQLFLQHFHAHHKDGQQCTAVGETIFSKGRVWFIFDFIVFDFFFRICNSLA